MSSVGSLQGSLANLGTGVLGRAAHWLDAMPHPELVCEIGPDRVAAARWGRQNLEGFASEPLPPGSLVCSPVQPNLTNSAAVAQALREVIGRVRGRRREVALLVPDAVIRVFIMPFESFPRRASQAVPLLRWRLKKSIPFDSEEAVISWMRQAAPETGLEIVAAVARTSVIREYEQAVEAAGMLAGVVLSSTLAALPLVEDSRVVLVARQNGTFLTTAILTGQRIFVYRCTEMGADAATLEVPALLSEIYPAVTYYQDKTHESVQRMLLGGFGSRFEEFRETLARELDCPVSVLGSGTGDGQNLPPDATGLIARELDSLVGWRMNRGA